MEGKPENKMEGKPEGKMEGQKKKRKYVKPNLKRLYEESKWRLDCLNQLSKNPRLVKLKKI